MARFLLLFFHNLLLLPGLLLMAPASLRKMKARGGSLADLWQRFGFFREDTKFQIHKLHQSGPVFWLHAASVGEVGIAARLIAELRRQHPALGMVLTTTTPTGLAEAVKLAGEHVVPLYSAIDGWFVVRRFLKLIQPEKLVLVEAEIWPNLLHACTRRDIPIILVNARLSPRSETRYRKAPFLTQTIFSMLHQIQVQEPEDAIRWQALGVPEGRVVTTGSIKFDLQSQAEPSAEIAEFQRLTTSLGWQPEDPVLLAASTHPGEEVELTKVYLKLKAEFPGLRLIMVPRHVERSAALHQDLLSLGLKLVRRSQVRLGTGTAASGDNLLVDTTGELRAWQYLATVVIIGKSFLAKGGQNPAEAIIARKPVVFGPHMENFEALVRLLHRHQGAIQVADFASLEVKLRQLLNQPSDAAQTAHSGREALLSHEGATARAARCLLKEPALQTV